MQTILKYRKLKSLKNAQNGKIENVAGSVWLCLFMSGTGKCKLKSTLPKSAEIDSVVFQLSQKRHLQTQTWEDPSLSCMLSEIFWQFALY
jgi:hypothetical protein